MEILTVDEGFEFVDRGRSVGRVPFNAVTKIAAYKLDQLTVDLICCEITTGSGDNERIYTVREELPGFDRLMERFAALPNFYRHWREVVVLPAFAENWTILYERGKADGEG